MTRVAEIINKGCGLRGTLCCSASVLLNAAEYMVDEANYVAKMMLIDGSLTDDKINKYREDILESCLPSMTRKFNFLDINSIFSNKNDYCCLSPKWLKYPVLFTGCKTYVFLHFGLNLYVIFVIFLPCILAKCRFDITYLQVIKYFL